MSTASEPPRDRPASPTSAQLREAQGRLFFAWLFTLPIMLAMAGSWALDSPWPSPLLHRGLMLVLAFPVLFVVGGDTLRAGLSDLRAARASLRAVVAVAAVGTYAAGALALVLPLPSLAGLAAIIVAFHLTGRYLASRG